MGPTSPLATRSNDSVPSSGPFERSAAKLVNAGEVIIETGMPVLTWEHPLVSRGKQVDALLAAAMVKPASLENSSQQPPQCRKTPKEVRRRPWCTAGALSVPIVLKRCGSRPSAAGGPNEEEER